MSRAYDIYQSNLLCFTVRGSRPGKNVQLTESEIRGLCLKSREIFLSQPILLELEAPLKICGKIRILYLDFFYQHGKRGRLTDLRYIFFYKTFHWSGKLSKKNLKSWYWFVFFVKEQKSLTWLKAQAHNVLILSFIHAKVLPIMICLTWLDKMFHKDGEFLWTENGEKEVYLKNLKPCMAE